MNMKRRTSWIALAAVAMLAASGCATASSADDSVAELDPNEPVEIVFESYNIGQAGVWEETINTLIDEFEAEHPNVTVTTQAPSADISGGNALTVASVQQQLLAGNPPDVAQLTFDTLDFVANELQPKAVEDIAGRDAVDEHLTGGEYPMHERAATLADWDGRHVGVPYVFSTPLMWYNATAFEAAGIDPDTVDLSSWEAIEEVGLQLADSTGKAPLTVSCLSKVGNWCMQGIVRSNDGRVLSEDRSSIEFGEDGAVGAVQAMRDLYDAGVIENLDSTAQYEAFARGESLMQLQTSVMQSTFMAAAEAGGWELQAAPMPGFGDQSAVPTNSGSALFVFSEDEAKQAASWEFIKHMTSPRAYELITSGIGYVPIRTGIVNEGGPLADWAAENPLVFPNIEQLDRLEPWISYPGNSYVQIDDLLWTAIEESVFYGADVEQTMAEAQERAQELVP
ncbi:MAG: extracellular solute-binding protein [Leucobacter sp.]